MKCALHVGRPLIALVHAEEVEAARALGMTVCPCTFEARAHVHVCVCRFDQRLHLARKFQGAPVKA